MTRLDDGTLEIKLTCYDNGNDHKGVETLTMLKKDEADNFLSDGASLLLMRFLVRTNFQGHLQFITFDNVLGLCTVNYFAAGEVHVSEEHTDNEEDNVSMGNGSFHGDGVHSKTGSADNLNTKPSRRAVRLVKIGRELWKNEDAMDRWMFYLFRNGKIYSWLHMNSPVYMEGTSDVWQNSVKNAHGENDQHVDHTVEMSGSTGKSNQMDDNSEQKLEDTSEPVLADVKSTVLNSIENPSKEDKLGQEQVMQDVAKDDAEKLDATSKIKFSEAVKSETEEHSPLEHNDTVPSPILTMKEFLNESRHIEDREKNQGKVAEESHATQNDMKPEDHHDGIVKSSMDLEPYPEDEPVVRGRLLDLHIPSTINEEDEKIFADSTTVDTHEQKQRSLESIAEGLEMSEEPAKEDLEETEQVAATKAPEKMILEKHVQTDKSELSPQEVEPHQPLKLDESSEHVQNIAHEGTAHEDFNEQMSMVRHNSLEKALDEPFHEAQNDHGETVKSHEVPTGSGYQTVETAAVKMHDAPTEENHERMSNLNRKRFKRLKNPTDCTDSHNFHENGTSSHEIMDESMQAECRTYLIDHPELRTLMSEFLQTLFIAKPKNVVNFAANYFQYIADISRLATPDDKQTD